MSFTNNQPAKRHPYQVAMPQNSVSQDKTEKTAVCVIRAYRDDDLGDFDNDLFGGNSERLEITSPSGKSIVINAKSLWRYQFKGGWIPGYWTIGKLWNRLDSKVSDLSSEGLKKGKKGNGSLTYETMEFLLFHAQQHQKDVIAKKAERSAKEVK